MKSIPTSLDGVLLFEPECLEDERGFFYESFRRSDLVKLGIRHQWVQDNRSYSKKGVVRGLHYQWPVPQAKLVSVLQGEIFDVAVDIRPSSATFCKWIGLNLSSENRLMLYIPPGFAHGFAVVLEGAFVSYKCSSYYRREYDRTILWNDEEIGIEWPIVRPIISLKDRSAEKLKGTKYEFLPQINV